MNSNPENWQGMKTVELELLPFFSLHLKEENQSEKRI